MGAPKHKWTQEEESALKSAVVKHGPGKWTTIVKDPEFSGVLYLRSNIDLKDKWRNMSITANGWGSRRKSKSAVKRTLSLHKQEENSLATTTSLQSDEEMMEFKHVSTTGSSALQVSTSAAPRSPSLRLDNIIMKAIVTLKEPGGSNKTAIRAYIEEQYNAPINFNKLLSTKLKDLIACGKLVKVSRKYRIPNSTQSSIEKKRSLRIVIGKQRITSLPSPKTDKDEVSILTKSQIDRELARMKSMSIHEAEEVAAQAVTEAEAAMAEAEEAEKEAKVAEAEAKVAQAFAEEALKTVKGRNSSKVVKTQALVQYMKSMTEKSFAKLRMVVMKM